MFSIVVALVLLRVVIGFHFFKEGTEKLRSGKFTAEFFLSEAKGPLAPYFQTLLRDHDGRERLCVEESVASNGETRIGFDTDLTFALWDDFRDQASLYYGFGTEELQAEIRERRKLLASQIHAARATHDASVDTRALEARRQADEDSILKLRGQLEQSDRIFEMNQEHLRSWLDTNRTEIISHFGSEHRLTGFDRDGENRGQVAKDVESLRLQVDTIRGNRSKRLAGWTDHIEGIWNSFEARINGLATDAQAELEPIRLHRPFDQPNSNLNMINRAIPWFDTIVGVLLVLGLFTRLASLAGAGFLASVIATQPPWIPGTVPSYYQAIEWVALIVIFTTCAGRLGGLDYFLSRFWSRRKRNAVTPVPENQNE